jgi:hypothetical protein
MKRSAPMSLLLHAKAGPGLAPPLNSQARVPDSVAFGAAYALPAGSGSEKEGCSGQTPVSRTPTMTPSPAFDCPPRLCHSTGAPMKPGDTSVCGCSTRSGSTAATPAVPTRPAISSGRTSIETPPKTRSYLPTTLALGAFALAAFSKAACFCLTWARYARLALDVGSKGRPVALALVGGKPLRCPS